MKSKQVKETRKMSAREPPSYHATVRPGVKHLRRRQ